MLTAYLSIGVCELPLSLWASLLSSVGGTCSMTCGISTQLLSEISRALPTQYDIPLQGAILSAIRQKTFQLVFTHTPSLISFSFLVFILRCPVCFFVCPCFLSFSFPFLPSTSPCPSSSACPPCLHSHTSFDTSSPLTDLQLRHVVHSRLFTPTLGILINSGLVLGSFHMGTDGAWVSG